MSDLLNARRNRKHFQRQLMATTSALGLVGCVIAIPTAQADDSGHATVWIELGGQFERTDGEQLAFTPSFIQATPWSTLGLTSPQAVETLSSYSYGFQGAILFQPVDSDWVFTAAARYGKAHGRKEFHQQTPPAPAHKGDGSLFAGTFDKLSDARANDLQPHAILDFQAGRDVGLGIFGSGGKSVIDFGIRFAQFGSSGAVDITARPDVVKYDEPVFPGRHFHLYNASIEASRNFQGIGPSFAWDASAPVAGQNKDSEITIDWGANASILFGRQKAAVHHQTVGSYHRTGLMGGFHQLAYSPYELGGFPSRRKSVVVPNVGGFAGLSFRYADAKVSFGYRADFFFGAMDGGIDTARKENVGFYGPFATISIGVGG